MHSIRDFKAHTTTLATVLANIMLSDTSSEDDVAKMIAKTKRLPHFLLYQDYLNPSPAHLKS